MIRHNPIRSVGSGVLLLGLAVMCSCRPESTPTTSGPTTRSTPKPLRIFVSIPPQRYFVTRVGGNRVDVSVLLPPGQSPATYEPTPKQMVRLADAQVFFQIGVPFERQVVAKLGAALEDLNIVDTNEEIELREMTATCDHDHDENAGHHQHNGGQDPHVWMNPRLVKLQAQTVCRELCRLDPLHREEYVQGLRSLEANLDDLDTRIAADLAPFRGREFYVFHPAFGYFAEAYGLEQVAIEAGGKQPTAKQLVALTDRAGVAGARLIFVQPQFDRRNAETVARQIGGAVVPMDPLAEDYIDNMRDIASKIKMAMLSPPRGEP